jgi:hypothetical protein
MDTDLALPLLDACVIFCRSRRLIDRRQSVLYHDPLLQNVYRSDNEGKSWQLIVGVPDGDASQLIEHPSDNSVVRPPPFAVKPVCGKRRLD